MLFFAVLIVAPLILLWWLKVRAENYWPSRNVPQEKPAVFFGNFAKVVFQKENIGTLTQNLCEKIKGPYYGLTIFHKHILVLNDPELIKTVLVEDFDKFPNRSVPDFESADPIMYKTLFSAPDQKWRILRSKLSPMFSPAKIKSALPLMVNCAKNMVDDIQKNSPKTVDFHEICSKYACDVITSCTFGIGANSFDGKNTQFYSAGRRMFQEKFAKSFAQFCYFFMPNLMPWFGMKFVDEDAAKFLKKVFLEVIQKKHNASGGGDFVEIFQKLRGDSDLVSLFNSGDDLVVAQAVNFFIAGVGSTGCVISFALHELALNSTLQEKLRKEIGECQMSYEKINEMTYLDMVIKEALRMYTFAPIITRKSSEEYTFKKTGLKIDKGTPIAISIRGVHYNSKFFPNPQKFDPERFSKANKPKIPPYTFLALGEGPRNCIGARFAVLSAKVGLVSILKNFLVEASPQTSHPVKLNKTSSFTIPKNGIPLKVSKI